MIIDAHAHLGKSNNVVYTEKQLLQSMKKAGIDVSLLITNRFLAEDGLSMEEGIGLAKKNKRFKIIGNIDSRGFGAKQIDKLKKYLTEKKIIGVKFYLGYEDYFAYDKRFYPLYEFCQKNNYPVVFHTGILESSFSGLLKYSHPLTIDEVANKFPNLKIVIAHFGNPWIMDCAAVVAKNKNVYMDMSGYFTEYEPIAQDEVEVFVKQLTEFKVFVGNFKKCLFGTDWPLYDQKEYVQAVQKIPMSKEEKDLVFYKNAVKVFNLQITP